MRVRSRKNKAMGEAQYRYSPTLGKRVAVETCPPLKQPPKHKRKPFKVEWFKHPAWWVKALHDASASAHQLALVILVEAFRREYVGGDIVLSAEVTGMAHTTRRRAVKELVDLGLIVVEQIGNGAPTVVHIFRRRGAKNGVQGAKNGQQGPLLIFFVFSLFS
jgi:hypothetical protein